MLSVASEDVYCADEEVFKRISLSAESEIELCVTGCLPFTTSPVIPYLTTIFSRVFPAVAHHVTVLPSITPSN